MHAPDKFDRRGYPAHGLGLPNAYVPDQRLASETASLTSRQSWVTLESRSGVVDVPGVAQEAIHGPSTVHWP